MSNPKLNNLWAYERECEFILQFYIVPHLPYLKPQEQKRMLWPNIKLILVLSDKGLALYNFPDYTLNIYHRYEEGVKIVPNESIPP
jgi:hypothetical protein